MKHSLRRALTPALLALLLPFACDSGPDAKSAEQAVKKAAASEAPAKAPEAKAPEAKAPEAKAKATTPKAPADPVAAHFVPEPKPTAGGIDWWCLCYQRKADAGPEDVTACRTARDSCEKLERRAGKGTRTIIKGSVSTTCRSLGGASEHPGDGIGGRDGWKPSASPGAYFKPGSCLLAGIPDPTPHQDPFAALGSEGFGELVLGVSAADVAANLGEPESKDEIIEEGATGDWVQTWSYPKQGLSITMAAGTEKGPQGIGSISVQKPSTLATKRGIKIGDTLAAARAKYKDMIIPDEQLDDPQVLVIGSIYGGLLIHAEGGTITEMFLGAAAE